MAMCKIQKKKIILHFNYAIVVLQTVFSERLALNCSSRQESNTYQSLPEVLDNSNYLWVYCIRIRTMSLDGLKSFRGRSLNS